MRSRSPSGTLSAAGLLLAAMLLAGCANDPEKAVVGQWKADDSASAIATRAARLKRDMPDAGGSDIMAAARALGHVGLELRADKTCELLMGGNKIQGDWSFDKGLNEVQLDLKTAEVVHENTDEDVGAFKPATYVAYLNDRGNLRLYPFDRYGYEILKSMDSAGNVGFVLYKE